MVLDQSLLKTVADVTPLRALLIEDNPNDAELCRMALEKLPSKIQLDIVATMRDFQERLRNAAYDVILSDFSLGTWNATDALKVIRTEKLDVPFILVTGTLGEEKAVACIKEGMDDFILKDRLERLPIAVLRAIEERRLRVEYRKAENSVRESETKFRTLADELPAAIFIERDGLCRYVNNAALDITGYNRDELLAMSFAQLIHQDSLEAIAEHQAKREKSPSTTHRFEIMIRPKSGEPRWLDIALGTFTDNGSPATLTTAFNVTERKKTNRENQNDAVTGLPNRQHLAAIFDTEASRTRRTGRAFSVMVLFLDGLDKIVRRYGQLVSGQTVRQAARTLRLHCRNLDAVGRVAADQFAIVLPETDVEGAQVVGTRAVARLSNADNTVPVSCRFGVAACPADGNTLEEVLKAASRQALSATPRS